METRFEDLINEIVKTGQHADFPKTTIEKEVLHHDILRILRNNGFLSELTFIGGTCLRLCYDAPRMSEDLDFTIGHPISETEITEIASDLKGKLNRKYGLPVDVRKPEKESETDTWIVKIITRPGERDIPSQKIHLDISHFPSFDRELRRLNNHYGIDLGTSNLLLYAESVEEILSDKVIALALRNRIKNRDIWDINYLDAKGVLLDSELTKKKLDSRNVPIAVFKERLAANIDEIGKEGFLNGFKNEMMRFVSKEMFENSVFSDARSAVFMETLLRGFLKSF